MYGEVLQQHPASIAFARLAAQHLAGGSLAAALRLAQQGVSHHPGYISGWIVLARIQCAQHRFGDARRALANAAAQYPDNAAVAALRAMIDAAEMQMPTDHGILDAQRRVLSDEGLSVPQEKGPRRGVSKVDDLIPGMESFLVQSQGASPLDAVSRQHQDAGNMQTGGVSGEIDQINDPDERTELERLAHTLESARLSVSPVESDEKADPEWTELPHPVDYSTRPVTRTLAEIYVGQGNIHEAIEIYLTLCAKYPDNQDEYISRIADLRRMLDSQAGS